MRMITGCRMETAMPYSLAELFDAAQLQQILDSFHDVTGVSVALVDREGAIFASSTRPSLCVEVHNARPGAVNGCHLCRAPLRDIPPGTRESGCCPYGLLNTIEPLIIQGEVWGSVMAGQVRDDVPEQRHDRQEMRWGEPGADRLRRMLAAVPVVERHRFDKAVLHLSGLATLLAEQALARRTSEKQERLIRHYADLAEEANRVKTGILGNLSHELRTPLNGIIGGTQLLRSTPLSAEQAGYLAIIEESSGSELALISNLLELVRLESRGGIVEQAPFSLRQCVDEVIRMNRSNARSKGLTLHQDLPPDLPLHVSGDKVHLRQILHALMGNAIKFTDAGSVTLRLIVEQREQGGLTACFSVADTGVGIEPPELDRVFEPFIQSDMSTTRRFGGLGLGLPLCRRLAELLGGRVWAESRPGEGSTFHLEAPFPALVSPAGEVRNRRTLNILLAEGDHLSVRRTAEQLQKLGYCVMTAASGAEAVEKRKHCTVDLILMDVQLPPLSGLDALQRIRMFEREQQAGRIPVVALTSSNRRNFPELFWNAGFDGFLQKPLQARKLEAVIAGCCP